MHIYPSILTNDLQLAQEQLDLSANCDDITVVQFDVIDGLFADNLTLTPYALQELNFHELQIDLHLMVEEPLYTVHELQELANDLPIRAVIAQIEKMSDDMEYVDAVKRNNWKVGLSLDLFTPVDEIEGSVLERIQFLQVMGNQAGIQGQSIHPHSIETLREAKSLVDDNNLEIEVLFDIGVKLDTIKQLATIGADGVSVGSGLWSAQDFNQAVTQLLQESELER